MYTPEGEWTEEAKQRVTKKLEQVYRAFCHDVFERRHIPIEKIAALEAEDFSGSEALGLGFNRCDWLTRSSSDRS